MQCREAVRNEEISIKYCSTVNQLADIFTKGLSKDKFDPLRSELRICKTNLRVVCWNEDQFCRIWR